MSVVPEEPKSYEDALTAFEALPTTSPDDERPEGDESAAPASTDPAAPVTEQPDVEAVRVKADIDALLDRPVPATDAFPKLFHGQPMRKLVASIQEQDRYISTTREELSRKNDELVAAQAAARVLMEIQKRGGPSVTPAATTPQGATPDEAAAFYRRHGVDDPFKEFTKDPVAFFHRLTQFAMADARAENQTILGRIEPLERTVTETTNREKVTVAKSAVDRAFDQICQEDKITDPTVRAKARERYDQLFASHDAALAQHVIAKSNIYDPASWVTAYRDVEKTVGGFPPLLAVAPPLPTNTTKANPPSSARAGASVIGTGGKRVSARRSQAVHDLFEGSGLPGDLIGKVEDEIAAGIPKGLIQE